MNEFFQDLDGARLVRYDEDSGLLLVWYGGHGINAYNTSGDTVAFWNIASKGDEATLEEIERSIENRVVKQDYENYAV